MNIHRHLDIIHSSSVSTVRIVPYERYVRTTCTLFLCASHVYHMVQFCVSGILYCQMMKPLNVKEL